MDAIRAEHLTRRFGETLAVDDVTFNVQPGEIFGLVGPDGAGKTTIMRLLTGILDPSAGEAFVDGLDIRKHAEAVKDRIGYMSQRFGLYPDLTVIENIDFYADLYGVTRKERGPRTRELLAFSNLTPFALRKAGNLSGGMKQKLGLACALIHTPRVLFLDEPTNGVDPVSRRDFWRILYRLLEERVTIFVSTAYMDEAERCGRIGLMHRGRLLACDSVPGVKRLMPGSLLELRCDAPRAAAALLRKEHDDVALFGDRIHIRVDDAEKATRSLQEAMGKAGFEIHELRGVEPTLEDIFMAVLPKETP